MTAQTANRCNYAACEKKRGDQRDRKHKSGGDSDYPQYVIGTCPKLGKRNHRKHHQLIVEHFFLYPAFLAECVQGDVLLFGQGKDLLPGKAFAAGTDKNAVPVCIGNQNPAALSEGAGLDAAGNPRYIKAQDQHAQRPALELQILPQDLADNQPGHVERLRGFRQSEPVFRTVAADGFQKPVALLHRQCAEKSPAAVRKLLGFAAVAGNGMLRKYVKLVGIRTCLVAEARLKAGVKRGLIHRKFRHELIQVAVAVARLAKENHLLDCGNVLVREHIACFIAAQNLAGNADAVNQRIELLRIAAGGRVDQLLHGQISGIPHIKKHRNRKHCHRGTHAHAEHQNRLGQHAHPVLLPFHS